MSENARRNNEVIELKLLNCPRGTTESLELDFARGDCKKEGKKEKKKLEVRSQRSREASLPQMEGPLRTVFRPQDYNVITDLDLASEEIGHSQRIITTENN